MTASELINDFLEQEKKKIPKPLRFLGFVPDIISTRDLVSDSNNLNLKDKKTIRPSWFNRTLASAYIIGVIVALVIVINLIRNGNLPLAVSIAFLLFLLFLFFMAIYFFFINRKTNYKLIIDKEGLRKGKYVFSWSDLAETAIMISPAGRGHQSYLILVTRDNKVLKFDLFNLAVSDEKLSAIIEYYKSFCTMR